MTDDGRVSFNVARRFGMLYAPIDSQSVGLITDGVLLCRGRRPVTLLINSPGGDLEDGLALYAMLLAARAPVTSVAVGCVASAAVLPFLAGKMRLVAPGTFIMTHQPQVETSASSTRTLAATQRTLKTSTRWYAEAIALATGMSVEAVEKRFLGHGGETCLTPTQAVACGVATGMLHVRRHFKQWGLA